MICLYFGEAPESDEDAWNYGDGIIYKGTGLAGVGTISELGASQEQCAQIYALCGAVAVAAIDYTSQMAEFVLDGVHYEMSAANNVWTSEDPTLENYNA